MSDEIMSIRQLAQALNRSHTTIISWLDRHDWPFPVDPPWPVAMVDEIEKWARKHLQPDRNERQRRPKSTLVDAMEWWGVTWQHMASDGNPFSVRKWLGDTLYNECTVPDFKMLASYLCVATCAAMNEAATARGEAGMPPTARRAYYERLFKMIDGHRWITLLNTFRYAWAADRFIDRPGWWRELADPWDEPPTGLLEEPLPHRRPAQSQGTAADIVGGVIADGGKYDLAAGEEADD